MPSKNYYTVLVLGKSRQVKRTLPKKGKVPKSRIVDVSVDPFDFELEDDVLFNREHSEAARKFFDKDKVLVRNDLTAEAFKKEARARFPEKAAESVNKAYDAFARERFRVQAWSPLLNSKMKKLLKRFDDNFMKVNTIGGEYVMEMSDPYPFLRRHLSCDLEVIEEFKLLAKQGHVFSQYMAGLLLTTMAGDFSEEGVPYLLEAYQNCFPRAMDSLAEYLLYKEDYLGAIQCSLLSIDSLDDSTHTLQKILGHTSNLMIEAEDAPVGSFMAFSSMMPLSHYILHFVLDETFKELAKKHFPEYYPSREEIDKAAIDMILRRGRRV